MVLLFEKGSLATSDCTIIAHQTNCFSVIQTPIAKQLQQLYPEAYHADKKYKLPPRERLGKFSFALNADGSKLIFHLYGQFRYGESGLYTDYDALHAAVEALFKAVTIAKEKGFPIKIGLPVDIGSALAGGHQPTILSLIEVLADTYGYDVHLYTH